MHHKVCQIKDRRGFEGPDAATRGRQEPPSQARGVSNKKSPSAGGSSGMPGFRTRPSREELEELC